MISSTLLEDMSRIEIDKIDKKTLADINSIQIDETLPISLRMQRYLEQVKNPYCFLCGDTPVRICFSPAGQELNVKIKNYFAALKRG